MAKISVLIPDAESTLSGHVIHCLSKDKNIEIHALSKDPESAVQYSRFVKTFSIYNSAEIGELVPDESVKNDIETSELIRFHYYDTSKSDALIEAIIKQAKRVGATLVLPVDEHIVKILSAHKDKFQGDVRLAPTPDHEMFMTGINKWRLAEFLTIHGVPHPKTVRYTQGTSESAFDTMRFPVITKPMDLGNAQGIHSFDNKIQMLEFLKGQQNHQYIVQPLIDGYDIDCSVLCTSGKIVAYTIQKAIAHPKVKYRAAVGIEFLNNDKVYAVVDQMMKLLNWSGVAHIDLRYDRADDTVKVIEINGRYWGSLLGSLGAGVNFAALAVKLANKESFPRPLFNYTRYFMGKAPIPRLLKSYFSAKPIRLFETSLYYTLRDPMPVVRELSRKFRRRLS